jgi:hypothetical protein
MQPIHQRRKQLARRLLLWNVSRIIFKVNTLQMGFFLSLSFRNHLRMLEGENKIEKNRLTHPDIFRRKWTELTRGVVIIASINWMTPYAMCQTRVFHLIITMYIIKYVHITENKQRLGQDKQFSQSYIANLRFEYRFAWFWKSKHNHHNQKAKTS